MSIDNLPPLRDVIKYFDIKAKKSLGQNFLLDLNLTKKIALLAGNLQGKHIIEIGSGPGGLTRALLSLGAKVTAIEADTRCTEALMQIKTQYKDQFNIIFGDALKQDYDKLSQACPMTTKIIANLPYNISTKLLTNWLSYNVWPPFYESLTLMFQKEVAQRIIAQSGNNHYGRLSVLVGWRTKAKIVYNLPAKAFTPPPKVESAVVHIVPKQNILTCDAQNIQLVTKLAFGQRRKMLRKSLNEIGGEKLLSKLNIDATLRAEDLSIEQFIAIAQSI